jgi:Tfp pilus assembly protein PilZ
VWSTEDEHEKRTSQRRAVVYPIRFSSKLLDFEAKAELVGEVLDVSSGGLFIRSEFLEVPGTRVSLQVWLPNARQPIALTGHVAWVTETPPKGPGMGIRLDGQWNE